MRQYEEICQRVIDTAIELADRGFLAGTGGNLALRFDADTFAITPSASDYYSMRADEISVLRLANLSQLAGSKAPSVASLVSPWSFCNCVSSAFLSADR